MNLPEGELIQLCIVITWSFKVVGVIGNSMAAKKRKHECKEYTRRIAEESSAATFIVKFPLGLELWAGVACWGELWIVLFFWGVFGQFDGSFLRSARFSDNSVEHFSKLSLRRSSSLCGHATLLPTQALRDHLLMTSYEWESFVSCTSCPQYF